MLPPWSPAQGAAPMGVQLKELLPRRKKRRPRTLMDEAERPLPGGGPAQGAAPIGVQLKELLQRKKKRIFPLSWPKHHPLPGGIRRYTLLPITRFLPAAI